MPEGGGRLPTRVTDDSVQNNTGPLGGPVIRLERLLVLYLKIMGLYESRLVGRLTFPFSTKIDYIGGDLVPQG